MRTQIYTCLFERKTKYENLLWRAKPEKYQIEFDEAEKPEWVYLASLKKESFQYPADEIFDLF